MIATDDLLEVGWLPIHMLDRSHRVVGLREVFAVADQASDLLVDPPERVAVLRLLIAIAARAGGLDQVAAYLDRHCGRFRLLDSERPFMQTAELEWAAPHAPSILVLVKGRWPISGDPRPSMSIPEAALALLRLHCYAPAGITGATVGDPRVSRGKVMPIGAGLGMRGTMIIPEGPTLADTMALSLAAVAGEYHPAPWEDGGPAVGDAPLGPVDLLTWPARHIRLHADAGGQVVDVVYTAGVPIPDEATVGMDVHQGWLQTTRWRPRTWPVGRAQAWQVIADLYGDLYGQARGSRTPAALDAVCGDVRMRVVSAHTDKYGTVIDDVSSDVLTVPGDDLHGAAERLRALRWAAMQVARMPLWLRAAAGSTETTLTVWDIEDGMRHADRYAQAAAMDADGWREKARAGLQQVVRELVDTDAAHRGFTIRPAPAGLAGWPEGEPSLTPAVALRIAQGAILTILLGKVGS